MREDGELLLSPQQVVLGEFKGQICNGDPRTMNNPHKNKDLGIVYSGYSRSMTGNKEKLDDFVKIIGGTVTFGGGDGKITGKGTIRTSKLNFENVYYVEELQNFNLFSVVLRVLRRHNLYYFGLSDIQPERDVTCLLAKASLDESTKWHRRMAHDILKKFDMESVRPATTPFEASKPKSKDEPDDVVNVHLYRSMIGSLMYLTASRPDIQFAVSACSRHQ
ncbi:hypothetical protein Tco_1250717, partial [Tanacetum coccineum]